MEFIEISKGKGEQFKPAIENGAMVLFYSDGCGHCTNMKPQWNALQEKINDLQKKFTMEDYTGESKCPNIVSVNVDAAPELDSQWHKHMESIPTIMAIKSNGGKVDFNDDRTTENFIQFMEKHLSVDKHNSHSKKKTSKKFGGTKKYKSFIVGGRKKKKITARRSRHKPKHKSKHTRKRRKQTKYKKNKK